jgi:hypothetical protein
VLSLAQVAYEAYGQVVSWRAHTGRAMPTWQALPALQRSAWEQAVQTVIDSEARRRAGDLDPTPEGQP